jgi:hypothetical protein
MHNYIYASIKKLVIFMYIPEDMTRLCTLACVAVSIEENTAANSDRSVGAW